MMSEIKNIDNTMEKKIRESLQADCQSCFGLCCTAINYASA